MEEQSYEQLQPTKPARVRRKWLRWLAGPAAIAVIAFAYLLTRPPELVWWRSPAIKGTATRVKCMVPGEWELENLADHGLKGYREEQGVAITFFAFSRPNRAPRIIEMAFPSHPDLGSVTVNVVRALRNSPLKPLKKYGTSVAFVNEEWEARRGYISSDKKLMVVVTYRREKRDVFEKTYRQICDSLTIE